MGGRVLVFGVGGRLCINLVGENRILSNVYVLLGFAPGLLLLYLWDGILQMFPRYKARLCNERDVLEGMGLTNVS